MPDIRAYAVGDEVAVYEIPPGANTPVVRLTTVERLTATQYVLANGTRFRRRNLAAIGDGPYTHTELLPLDDERVIHARARRRLRNAQRDIDDLFARLKPNATPSDCYGLLAEVSTRTRRGQAAIAELIQTP